MTQKQIGRYHVIMKNLEGKLTVTETAESLGISERQVMRLRKGVTEEGAAFLIHKNTNRLPAHALTETRRKQIVDLYHSEVFEGANFQHFSELLSEHEGITQSYSTVRKVLVEAGIESPKKRRKFKPHRRRKRKAQEGLLIQMDATPFEWFGGKIKFSLHGGIDDATGKIVGLYMTQNECLQGYFETVRQIVEQNGMPIGIYSDRHTIFRSPNADKLTLEDQLAGKQTADTQFGRAMKELGVTIITARSAQAKGRIERLWETLQSRLVIEFRVHDIKTVHEANAFLTDYIPIFNEKFGVDPEQSEKAYSPASPDLDLDLILCVKESRTADNGGVFSFGGKTWKISSDNIPGKTKIEVVASSVKGIIALYKNKAYDVLPYIKPKKTCHKKAERETVKPSENHCWKQGAPQTPLYSSDLVDSAIREMLEDIFLSKYA